MGSSKKPKRGDRGSVEERTGTAKKSNMAAAEGENSLFSEQEPTLHETKQLFANSQAQSSPISQKVEKKSWQSWKSQYLFLLKWDYSELQSIKLKSPRLVKRVAK